MFWSELGSGFGGTGRHTPPRIPRGTLRVLHLKNDKFIHDLLNLYAILIIYEVTFLHVTEFVRNDFAFFKLSFSFQNSHSLKERLCDITVISSINVM